MKVQPLFLRQKLATFKYLVDINMIVVCFTKKHTLLLGKKAKVDELQTRKRIEPVVQRSAAA